MTGSEQKRSETMGIWVHSKTNVACNEVHFRFFFCFSLIESHLLCTVPATSMPLALHLMEQKDAALSAVDDTLCLAKDILVREEFLQLEAEMKLFVDSALLAEH